MRARNTPVSHKSLESTAGCATIQTDWSRFRRGLGRHRNCFSEFAKTTSPTFRGPMTLRAELRKDRQGNQVIRQALSMQTPVVQGTQSNAVKWLERMLKLSGFNTGALD